MHVVEERLRADPPALLRWVGEAGATVCLFPTPHAELVLQTRWPPAAACLRVLYTGGEKLKGGAPHSAPPFRFDNHYGPAENTVLSTVETLTHAYPARLPTLPLGYSYFEAFSPHRSRKERRVS